MKKKLSRTLCLILTAALLVSLLAACGDTGKDPSGGKDTDLSEGPNDQDPSGGEFGAAQAEDVIASFLAGPTVIDAVFTQTFTLVVDSDNASMSSFEKDVSDTVLLQVDLTAGDLYYYGRREVKDGTVAEQLLLKDGEGYVFLTTDTPAQPLESEEAARAKIDELMTALTYQTSGYADTGIFLYGPEWVHSYLLLGSGTLSGNEKSCFTYSYSNPSGGLRVEIGTKYVGYYGDAGTFEFGINDAHTGGSAVIETTGEGYVTSFIQSLDHHLDMAIVAPPVPLDYVGTRSLTASYGGILERKSPGDIVTLAGDPTVTFSGDDLAAVEVLDMVIEGQTPTSMDPVTSGGTVAPGHWVAVKAAPAEGYEVSSVTVGGNETISIAGFYCYQVKDADVNLELKVSVTVRPVGLDPNVTTGTITVEPVEHAQITTFDFDYGAFSFVEGTEVQMGHFVALQVACDEGYAVDTVKVNGEDATFINGYYCCMTPVAAGLTYTVTVTLNTNI